VRAAADGRIFVLGDAILDSTSRGIVVFGYLATGGPDPSFGIDGGVAFGTAGEDDRSADLLVTDAGVVACFTR
jgi:hypothetical protein